MTPQEPHSDQWIRVRFMDKDAAHFPVPNHFGLIYGEDAFTVVGQCHAVHGLPVIMEFRADVSDRRSDGQSDSPRGAPCLRPHYTRIRPIQPPIYSMSAGRSLVSS
jgi:hypothetical protein